MSIDPAEPDTARSSGSRSIPLWFWLISIVALLWFLMDLSAFVMRVLMTEDVIQAMPEGERHLYRDMPSWVNVVFAGDVVGGALGCIGLLLRRRWALLLFVISVLGVLGQTFHVWLLSDAIATMGAPVIVMPALAISIGLGMIALARSAIARGWLR